jgi:hypothetical protein
MKNPDEHVRDLLNAHDGDDRCGCVRSCAWHLLESTWTVDTVIDVMSTCLATHPGGLTYRASSEDPLGILR